MGCWGLFACCQAKGFEASVDELGKLSENLTVRRIREISETIPCEVFFATLVDSSFGDDELEFI